MGKGSTGGGTTLPVAIEPVTVLAACVVACSDALMKAMVEEPAASCFRQHRPQSLPLSAVAAAHSDPLGSHP